MSLPFSCTWKANVSFLPQHAVTHFPSVFILVTDDYNIMKTSSTEVNDVLRDEWRAFHLDTGSAAQTHQSGTPSPILSPSCGTLQQREESE